MPKVIILAAADVAVVTWTSANGMAALLPVVLTDGRAIVGPEILSDPIHRQSRARLLGLTQVDYSTIVDLLPRRS
jgi:hypothetical protein